MNILDIESELALKQRLKHRERVFIAAGFVLGSRVVVRKRPEPSYKAVCQFMVEGHPAPFKTADLAAGWIQERNPTFNVHARHIYTASIKGCRVAGLRVSKVTPAK